MAGKDIQRAGDLRRLFEQQLSKVDSKKDHKARMQEAASLMDRLVGAEWRGEVQLPGIEVVEIEIVGEGTPAGDPQSFYDRVHHAMQEAGMDYKDDEDLDTHEAKAPRERSGLVCQIMDLVDKLANL